MSLSRSEWLGTIPTAWDCLPFKALFRQRRESATEALPHLTPSQTHGVLPQDEYVAVTGNRVVASNAAPEQMQVMRSGDFVSHLRSFQGGLERSSFDGRVSPAYTVITPQTAIDHRYFGYLFKCERFVQAIRATTEQLRDGQNIRMGQLSSMDLPAPPLVVQSAIADFLDQETAEIDAFIADQLRLVELLLDRRTSAIVRGTTVGLAQNPATRPSGVGWLGSVRADAEVVRLRRLARVRTGSGDSVDAIEEGGIPFYVRSELPLRACKAEFQGPAILTAGDGAGVGKVFHLVEGEFAAHQRVYVIDDFKLVAPEYLYYAFSSMFSRVALDGSAKSTVDSVRRWMITDFPIVVPPKAEQRKVVEYLDAETIAIDAAIEDARATVSLSRERRVALISAAVTGKIDVTA